MLHLDSSARADFHALRVVFTRLARWSDLFPRQVMVTTRRTPQK
jgi:hypothetical protein